RDADGSTFLGPLVLYTGGGNDFVAIHDTFGAAVTDFQGPVTVNLGDGDDSLSLALSGTAKFEAAAGQPVVFDGGLGNNTGVVDLANVPGRHPTIRRIMLTVP